MADETKTTEEVAAVEPTEVPNVTAGDLATMVRVIDAGSQRGAWRGEELTTVGTLRDKLAAVVNALNPNVSEEATEVADDDSVGPEAPTTESDSVTDAA